MPQRRIVDEDIDAAEMLFRGLRHRLHGRGVGDIADMDQRLAALGRDLARNRICFGAIAARIDQNGSAALRQRQRDGTADVAPRAGDDGDLAAEFVGARHESYPRSGERSMRPL